MASPEVSSISSRKVKLLIVFKKWGRRHKSNLYKFHKLFTDMYGRNQKLVNINVTAGIPVFLKVAICIIGS